MFCFDFGNLKFCHRVCVSDGEVNCFDVISNSFNSENSDFFQIIYFVKGDIKICVNNFERRLQQGDVVIIPPSTYYKAKINKNFNLEMYCIKVAQELVPESLSKTLIESKPFYDKNATLNFLFSDVEEFLNNSKYSNEDKAIVFKCEVLKFLVLLSKQDCDSTNKEIVFNLLLNYINTHIGEKLTLTNISETFNYSESYLSKLFKEKMNCSIMYFIRNKKCVLANEMIAKGEKPREVCIRLGFDEYSTFYRCYKSITGYSPSRKSILQNKELSLRKLSGNMSTSKSDKK